MSSVKKRQLVCQLLESRRVLAIGPEPIFESALGPDPGPLVLEPRYRSGVMDGGQADMKSLDYCLNGSMTSDPNLSDPIADFSSNNLLPSANSNFGSLEASDAVNAIAIENISSGDESNGNSVIFEATRTGDLTSPLTLSYSLSGTAIAHVDYLDPNNGAVVFASDEDAILISLPVLSDQVVDPGEIVRVRVDSSSDYDVVPGKQFAVGTITAENVETTVRDPSGEYTVRNEGAFAVVRHRGSVVTWGREDYGGNSQGVATDLEAGVLQVYSTQRAFAALKDDGAVVTWGDGGWGGNSSSVIAQLQSGVVEIFSTASAFAALKNDGSAVTWGSGIVNSSIADQLNGNVVRIFSNAFAFAALKDDGSVVTWGNAGYGGDQSAVANQLTSGVTRIYSTQRAFAALKQDGSVVTWGDSSRGGNSTAVAAALADGVVEIYATDSAFAALKNDGSVVTWGNSGGNSSSVADRLASGVVKIFSGSSNFAALKDDGSIVTWPSSTANSGSWAERVSSGVVDVSIVGTSFAVLKDDGSVVTWGNVLSDSVAEALTEGVTQVFHNEWAFAALKGDGSVVTWGHVSYGGDSSDVAAHLTGDVVEVFSTATSFAALKDDGSVIAWPESLPAGDTSEVELELYQGVIGFADPELKMRAITYENLQPNHPPTGQSSTVTIDDYDSYAFEFEAFGFADEDGDTLDSVIVKTLPQRGALTFDGGPVLPDQEIPGERVHRLVYRPDRDSSGDDYAEITFQVRDDGGTRDGGNDTSDSFTKTFRVVSSISLAAVAPGDESDGSPVVFEVTRTGDLNAPLTVPYSLFGTAILGQDFEDPNNGSVVLQSGESSKQIQLPTLADNVIDPGEMIRMRVDLSDDFEIVPGKQFANETITAENVTSEIQDTWSQETYPYGAWSQTGLTVIKDDGSVVTWGQSSHYESVTESVAEQLAANVSLVRRNAIASAALRDDGSVVTWGATSAGGDSSEVSDQLASGVVDIAASEWAFAALKVDGSVVAWGDKNHGGDSGPVANLLTSGVVSLFATEEGFAAFKANGSVVTWGRANGNGNLWASGDSAWGGSSVSDPGAGVGVVQVVSGLNSFTGLTDTGQVVVTRRDYPDEQTTTDHLPLDVVAIYPSHDNFAALRNDGAVVTYSGRESRAVRKEISGGVTQVFSNLIATAVLKEDGSVTTWGDGESADSSAVADALSGGVVQIFVSYDAFAALKEDGSVVTWGASSRGGDSSDVAAELQQGVRYLYSNGNAFAALKNDGSVVTWGLDGGRASVAEQLQSGVVQVIPLNGGFAALKDDGAIVIWENQSVYPVPVPEAMTEGVVAFADSLLKMRLLNASDQSPNRPPRASGFTITVPAAETYGFSAADFSFADADGDDLSAVIIKTLPQSGSLAYGGVPVAVDQSIPAGSLDQLVFSPAQGASDDTSTRFGFQVQDDGGTQDGGVDLSESFTVKINPPRISVKPVSSGSEADGSPVAFELSRSGDLTEPLTVHYSLFGTALLGQDYLDPNGGAVDFAAGMDVLPVSFPVLDDGVFDPAETIRFRVNSSVDYHIEPGHQFGVETISAEKTRTEYRADVGTPVNPGGFSAVKVDGSVISWGSSPGVDDERLGTGEIKLFRSGSAFAAIKSDGSVTTWGNSFDGGDSGDVAAQLTSGVIDIFALGGGFAALKDGGSVVTWPVNNSKGGNSSAVASQLTSGVVTVIANDAAVAALKDDGSVVTWGSSSYGGNSSAVATKLSSGVVQIFASQRAFAALKDDGSVVTWGHNSFGGNSSSVEGQLAGGVDHVFSNGKAFAALKDDGSVVTWGPQDGGGDSGASADQLSSGVVDIFVTDEAFAALKTDGSVVSWGSTWFGGLSKGVASQLSSGVSRVFSNEAAFAALKEDGSIVTWGEASAGGRTSLFADPFGSGFVHLVSNDGAFAGLKEDGSLVTWGQSNSGGDSSGVADKLNSGVTRVVTASSGFAQNGFAALKADGSVVAWGHETLEHTYWQVAHQLTSGVVQIFSNGSAFAALKEDGSVVTWGQHGSGGDSRAVHGELSGGIVALIDAELVMFPTIVADALINIPPSAASSSISVGYGGNHIFSQSEFGFTDSDGDKLHSVIIKTLPLQGTLAFDGVPVSVNQSIPADSLHQLVFTPTPGATGDDYASFDFQVRDDGGTENGGLDVSDTFTTTFNIVDTVAVQSVSSGDESSGAPVVFEVNRTGDLNATLTVHYSLFGSAVVGRDYLDANNGSLIFAEGVDSLLISLAVLTDDGFDPGESIRLRIDSSNEYTIVAGKQFAVEAIRAENIESGIKENASGYNVSNSHALAAIKADGSVVTWGDSVRGGDSAAVADQLTSGVVQIYSNANAFAALKADGSVVVWGDSTNGGDHSAVASQLESGVTEIFSSERAFAALKDDGSVVTWGRIGYGADSSDVAAQLTSNVVAITPNARAFAAMKDDGSVVTWGHSGSGGDHSAVANELAGGVVQVIANDAAFAALKQDGSVVTWGNGSWGGNSASVADRLTSGVEKLFAGSRAFAALKDDGSLVTWGHSSYGGDSSSVAARLATGVIQVFAADWAFAALKEDGSVVTWGYSRFDSYGRSEYGGDSSNVTELLASGVVELVATPGAFAALKEDGSVVSWGHYDRGGLSCDLADQLTSDVIQIFSSGSAFAALKNDGSVVSWGSASNGGDSHFVSSELAGGVTQVFANDEAFAALKDDGSIVTWGGTATGGFLGNMADQVSQEVVAIGDSRLNLRVTTDQTPPVVESIVINDGRASRSNVTSLTVNLGGTVNPQLLQSAFRVTNISTGQIVDSLIVGTPVFQAGKTHVTLTFGSGNSVVDRIGTGLLGNTLADGNYRLDIAADSVESLTNNQTMLTDYVFGGQTANAANNDNFFRLYGDGDGDGDVDGQDYGRFGLTFLKRVGDPNYNPDFDSDGDGDVDARDYGRFGSRFLRTRA